MGTVSINNLWTFIQGLSLSASDRKWLAGKLLEPPVAAKNSQEMEIIDGYPISPRMKKLMGSVHIDPKDVENDDRLKYILNK